MSGFTRDHLEQIDALPVLGKLKELAEKTAALKNELAHWAPEAERQRVCEKHGNTTPIDWDASAHATAKVRLDLGNDQVCRLVHFRCQKCVADEGIAKQSAWLQACGVPANMLHCSFENYQVRVANDLAHAKKFASRKKGCLVIRGEDMGVGKSHLAVAIMREIGGGIFVTNDMLMVQIRKEYRQNGQVGLTTKERCIKTKLLIIDDLGTADGGGDVLTSLHTILTARHGNKLPSVRTTNMTEEQIEDYVGKRVFNRLDESLHTCITLTGESMRKQARTAYFED